MSWPVPSKLARQIHAILTVGYGMGAYVAESEKPELPGAEWKHEGMDAEEARRKSEEVSGKGAYSELREQIYSMIEGQVSLGQRSVATAQQTKYPALAYEALYEELKKDGYQVSPASPTSLMTISW